MVFKHRKALAIMACVIGAQTACFKLGRETPVLQEYVLASGGVKADVTAPQRVGGTRIGVRRLDLAKYLASPAIVVRRGEHGIVISEFHRWGEDPMQGINRALAAHLASTPSVGAVHVAPWAPRTAHDYLVQLHVSRFEGVADSLATIGEAQLGATWEIIRPTDDVVMARGNTDYRQPNWHVGDYNELVNLLNAGLQELSKDVITCIARLPSGAGDTGISIPAPIACARAN